MASATFCSKSNGEWGCWRRDPKTQWINGEGVLWVIQKVPDLWWFHLRWFECMMVRKQSAFGRKCAWDVELRHFLGLGTWGTIFSRDAGQRAAAPSSHTIVRPNNPHTGDHSAPTQPLRVPFSTGFSELHEIIHKLVSKSLCVRWLCPMVATMSVENRGQAGYDVWEVLSFKCILT